MRIVVGYITSPEGHAALDAAISETRLRDAELVLDHSMRGGTRDEAAESIAYHKEFAAIEQRLSAESIPHRVRQLVLGQTPAEDVIQVANEESADLIVIGLRPRSPVGKLLLGSNAQEILLGAECPVLAVKAE